MKNYFIILISSILILVSSCKEKQNYLIPQDEMIDVLVDIHIADGVLNTASFSYEDEQLRPENYYKNVLEKHHLTRLEFDSALSQYTQDRKNYLKMYDKVIEKIRTKESLVKAKSEEKKEGVLVEYFHHSINRNYENKKGLELEIQRRLTDKEARKSKYSYEVKGDEKAQVYDEVLENPVEEIKFDISCYVKFYEHQEVYPSLAFILTKNDKVLSKQYIVIDKFIEKLGSWNHIKLSAKLSLRTPESGVKVSTFFYNPKKATFFIDNYSLDIRQIK